MFRFNINLMKFRTLFDSLTRLSPLSCTNPSFLIINTSGHGCCGGRGVLSGMNFFEGKLRTSLIGQVHQARYGHKYIVQLSIRWYRRRANAMTQKLQVLNPVIDQRTQLLLTKGSHNPSFKEEKKEIKETLSNKESITTAENIWTIPNILCFSRIGMAPVVAYMILNNQFGPALGVFAVAGVTDLLDGWIARVVPGQSTVMGSFLDPMADKILVGTLFLSLTYMDLIPVLLTGLIIGRDAILITSGFYIRYQSLDPPRSISRYFNVTYPTAQLAPTLISKINTGVQLGLVGATMVSAVIPYDVHAILEFLWYFTATTTVVSAVGYLFAKDTVKLLRKRGVKSYSEKQK